MCRTWPDSVCVMDEERDFQNLNVKAVDNVYISYNTS